MRLILVTLVSLFVVSASAITIKITISWEQPDWSVEGDTGQMGHVLYHWEEGKPEVAIDLGVLTPISYNVQTKVSQYEYPFPNHGWVEGRTYYVQMEAYRIKDGQKIMSGRSNTPSERIDYVVPKQPENIVIEEKKE